MAHSPSGSIDSGSEKRHVRRRTYVKEEEVLEDDASDSSYSSDDDGQKAGIYYKAKKKEERERSHTHRSNRSRHHRENSISRQSRHSRHSGKASMIEQRRKSYHQRRRSQSKSHKSQKSKHSNIQFDRRRSHSKSRGALSRKQSNPATVQSRQYSQANSIIKPGLQNKKSNGTQGGGVGGGGGTGPNGRHFTFDSNIKFDENAEEDGYDEHIQIGALAMDEDLTPQLQTSTRNRTGQHSKKTSKTKMGLVDRTGQTQINGNGKTKHVQQNSNNSYNKRKNKNDGTNNNNNKNSSGKNNNNNNNNNNTTENKNNTNQQNGKNNNNKNNTKNNTNNNNNKNSKQDNNKQGEKQNGKQEKQKEKQKQHKGNKNNRSHQVDPVTLARIKLEEMVNRHIQNSNTNNIDSNLRWFDDYVLSPKSNERYSESNGSDGVMGNGDGSGDSSGRNGKRMGSAFKFGASGGDSDEDYYKDEFLMPPEEYMYYDHEFVHDQIYSECDYFYNYFLWNTHSTQCYNYNNFHFLESNNVKQESSTLDVIACVVTTYHNYPMELIFGSFKESENVGVWHYVSGDPFSNHSSKREPRIKFIGLIPTKDITMPHQVNKYAKRNFSANVQLPLTIIRQNGRKKRHRAKNNKDKDKDKKAQSTVTSPSRKSKRNRLRNNNSSNKSTKSNKGKKNSKRMTFEDRQERDKSFYDKLDQFLIESYAEPYSRSKKEVPIELQSIENYRKCLNIVWEIEVTPETRSREQTPDIAMTYPTDNETQGTPSAGNSRRASKSKTPQPPGTSPAITPGTGAGAGAGAGQANGDHSSKNSLSQPVNTSHIHNHTSSFVTGGVPGGVPGGPIHSKHSSNASNGSKGIDDKDDLRYHLKYKNRVGILEKDGFRRRKNYWARGPFGNLLNFINFDNIDSDKRYEWRNGDKMGFSIHTNEITNILFDQSRKNVTICKNNGLCIVYDISELIRQFRIRVKEDARKKEQWMNARRTHKGDKNKSNINKLKPPPFNYIHSNLKPEKLFLIPFFQQIKWLTDTIIVFTLCTQYPIKCSVLYVYDTQYKRLIDKFKYCEREILDFDCTFNFLADKYYIVVALETFYFRFTARNAPISQILKNTREYEYITDKELEYGSIPNGKHSNELDPLANRKLHRMNDDEDRSDYIDEAELADNADMANNSKFYYKSEDFDREPVLLYEFDQLIYYQNLENEMKNENMEKNNNDKSKDKSKEEKSNVEENTENKDDNITPAILKMEEDLWNLEYTELHCVHKVQFSPSGHSMIIAGFDQNFRGLYEVHTFSLQFNDWYLLTENYDFTIDFDYGGAFVPETYFKSLSWLNDYTVLCNQTGTYMYGYLQCALKVDIGYPFINGLNIRSHNSRMPTLADWIDKNCFSNISYYKINQENRENKTIQMYNKIEKLTDCQLGKKQYAYINESSGHLVFEHIQICFSENAGVNIGLLIAQYVGWSINHIAFAVARQFQQRKYTTGMGFDHGYGTVVYKSFDKNIVEMYLSGPERTLMNAKLAC